MYFPSEFLLKMNPFQSSAPSFIIKYLAQLFSICSLITLPPFDSIFVVISSHSSLVYDFVTILKCTSLNTVPNMLCVFLANKGCCTVNELLSMWISGGKYIFSSSFDPEITESINHWVVTTYGDIELSKDPAFPRICLSG